MQFVMGKLILDTMQGPRVYEDLYKAGVIDPTKVARVALENAISISGMMLTTECVISDFEEEASTATPSAMPGGMGGMM